MKNRLLLFVLFFPFFGVSSQTYFSPDFRLGDTSQIHILTTYRGDRLMGTVTNWAADSIFVQQKTGTKMWVKLASLETVWVAGESSPPKMNAKSRGLFVMSAHEGTKVYSGRLKIVDKRQIKFHPDGKGLSYFTYDDLDNVKFMPHPAGYINQFTLKKEGEKERTVHFISYEKGVITVRENGAILTYTKEDEIRLYLKKQRPSSIGKQRQLFLSPTGFNMKAKQTVFTSSMLAHNEISKGLTDYFSVGVGGFAILPYASGRLSFSPHRLLHLSAGGLWTTPINNNGAGWHIAATFGTRNYFVNIARIKYVGEMFLIPNDFTATSLGASMRVGSRIFIYGECNFIDQHPGGFMETLEGRVNIFSAGLKVYGMKNVVTLGFMGLGPRGQICSDCPLQNEIYPAFSVTIPLGV